MTVETAEDFPFDLIPGGKSYPFRGSQTKAYVYRVPLKGKEIIIWGMTAKLLHEFVERYRREVL